MYQTLELFPGVTLRYLHSSRFKQGVMSIQLLRPMDKGEAAMNALLPEILLRGCKNSPDLRQITQRLDDLYGAAVSGQVRRIGDYQTLGLACGFMEDRFALPGDEILRPMTAFLGQLLLQPVEEKGGFCRDYVYGEKKNLISALESQRNDKGAYAAGRLLKIMCKGDSYAVPRLGTIAGVKKITAAGIYAHYRQVLAESPIEIFYVGSAPMEAVAQLLRPMFSGRQVLQLPAQTPLSVGKPVHREEVMDISQAKLSMGFVTPITNRDSRFAAMQLCNAIFGSGMTSKLFMKVREELGLCYAISSGYYGSKGILTVNAGADSSRCEEVREAVLQQLEHMAQGGISTRELENAKQSILSGLRSVYDSPGAMESFFSTAALSGLDRSPETYGAQIQAVTLEDVVDAAATVRIHSSFFLKGGSHG